MYDRGMYAIRYVRGIICVGLPEPLEAKAGGPGETAVSPARCRFQPVLPGAALLVQAMCAQKQLNRAKLSTSMKLSTMLGHHIGTNFRYGAMQKINIFTMAAIFVPPLPHF